RAGVAAAPVRLPLGRRNRRRGGVEAGALTIFAASTMGLDSAALKVEEAIEEVLFERPQLPLHHKLRRSFGALLVDHFFIGASRAGALVPLSNPRFHKVEVTRDVPYTESGRREHLLDVYRPRHANGPLPVVLYLHG